MEKRSLTHLAGFALALSVILAGSTIFYAHREAQYKAYVQTQHENSLSQVLSSLNQLETSLEKAQYVPAGAMRQTLAADVWSESLLASAALSSLPLGDQRLEQVETYIAQVGDYAYYLMRSGAYDRADSEEWAKLCSLCDNAAGMLKSMDQLKEQVDTGSTAFRLVTADAQAADGVRDTLGQINDEFPEYASLIYDGPYSDHVSQQTPKALEGQPQLTEEQAREKAAQLLGVSPAQLSLDYETAGQIPAYGFSCDTKTVAISKQGGLALSMADGRGFGTAQLTAQQAIEKASAFLDTLDLPKMTHSYYTIYETIITINFHCSENDVMAYPDLVKVGVALDDGSIVRLDTSGFAMNHHQRAPAAPAVSLEEARKSVPDNLTVESENLAYIPTTGHNEVLCWEFVCKTASGGHALLYVNCENGQAENILLLIESESGTLTR